MSPYLSVRCLCAAPQVRSQLVSGALPIGGRKIGGGPDIRGASPYGTPKSPINSPLVSDGATLMALNIEAVPGAWWQRAVPCGGSLHTGVWSPAMPMAGFAGVGLFDLCCSILHAICAVVQGLGQELIQEHNMEGWAIPATLTLSLLPPFHRLFDPTLLAL